MDHTVGKQAGSGGSGHCPYATRHTDRLLSRRKRQKYNLKSDRDTDQSPVPDDPVHMSRWKAICTIKDKKGDYGTLNYLSVDAIALILKQVETNTVRGVRDLTMLSLLYNSGARVQELINLTPKSIRKEKPYELELFGKGSKRRLVPLDGPMMQLLNRYMNEYK